MRAHYIIAVVILAIHATPLHAQAKRNCPFGQFFVFNSCKPCPPGTFRVVNTTNTCVECPRGTFNPIKGVGNRRLCQLCDENTFSSKKGSARCEMCPEGTVAHRGASDCRVCGPGFYFYDGKCNSCPTGQYNEKNASLECMSCPFPLSSPKGSTSRSACTSKPGREGDTRLCPADTFSRRPYLKCRPCPEGTKSNGPGATRCRVIGSTRCPSGTFENKYGDCDLCRRSFRYNKEERVCEQCPSGSVSKGGLRRDCIKCPPGQIAITELGIEGCKCPEGMFRNKKTCEPCPSGTGGNYGNAFGRRGCIPCAPGFFSDKPGSKQCKPCPIGTISEEGAKICQRCPRGFVGKPLGKEDFGGSTRCLSIATGCPPGHLPTIVFGDVKCQTRVFCQVGTPEKDIGIKCIPCEPGFRLVDEKCKRCPLDSVSNGGGITSCTKCKNGRVRSIADPSKCVCSGYGEVGNGMQDGLCKACPPGSIEHPYIDTQECTKCRRGTFTNGFGRTVCTRCPKGTFSDFEGSVSCKTCPGGYVPATTIGARSCVPTL